MRPISLACLIILGGLYVCPTWAGPMSPAGGMLGGHGGASPGPIHIGGPLSLGEVLFGSHRDSQNKAAFPSVARYAADGDEAFIFDRSTQPPLMRFEDSSEIWVLQAQPAPRGDIIYRNDVGQAMLRATKLGGLTLFSREHPDGAAAAFDGDAPSLHPLVILTPNALLQRMAQASARSSHALQHLVAFDAPDVTAQTAAMVADAATVASDAVSDLSRRGETQHGLARLNRVLIVPGHKASVVMTESVLRIVISPRQGLAGRPSSSRISAALTR